MLSSLVLGTAQFGLDYGINNQRGKIPQDEVFKILDEAQKNKIHILDTAAAYGNSEEVIGQYIQRTKSHWQIISKLRREDELNVDAAVSQSLTVLGVKKLYGYLIHDFGSFTNNPNIWKKLEARKKSGDIQKIGFSLYYLQDGEAILNQNIPVDIIQIPYSVFDRRFEKLVPEFKKRRIEIHVRSAFLQGLFFKDIEKLPSMFLSVKDKIGAIQNIAKKNQLSVSDVCLGFCLEQKSVDAVVIGVDGLKNLTDNLEVFKKIDRIKMMLHVLSGLGVDDEKVLLPVHWKF